MKISSELKIGLLAATSVLAANAHAAPPVDSDVAAHPTIEIAQPLPAVNADGALPGGAQEAKPAVKPWFFAALLAGGVAAFARIFGVRRALDLAASAAPAVVRTAKAAAAAPVKVAKAAASAASSPLRFGLVFASLGLVAFLGVGFYNVEWLGGLGVGAAMSALALTAANKTKKAFAFVKGEGRRPRS